MSLMVKETAAGQLKELDTIELRNAHAVPASSRKTTQLNVFGAHAEVYDELNSIFENHPASVGVANQTLRIRGDKLSVCTILVLVGGDKLSHKSGRRQMISRSTSTVTVTTTNVHATFSPWNKSLCANSKVINYTPHRCDEIAPLLT